MEQFKFENEIIDLKNNFKNCRYLLDSNKPGAARTLKGNSIVDYFSSIIAKSIPKKYIIEKSIYLYSDNLQTEADLCVYDENEKPILFIECKDYTDSCMFRRIIGDLIIVKTNYPKIKFVSLSMQESTINGLTDKYNEFLEKYYGFGNAIHSISLLNNKRKSINNIEYLTDKTNDEINAFTTIFAAKIKKIIND